MTAIASTVTRYPDARAFWAVAGPLFESDPIRHTVPVTVLAQLRAAATADGGAIFLTVHRGDDLVGATFRTPPWPLSLSAVPFEAQPALLAYLVEHGLVPDCLQGPRDAVDPFAEAVQAHTGWSVRLRRGEMLYRLGELDGPVDVPGRFRFSTDADQALLDRWWDEFMVEAIGGTRPDATDGMRAGRGYGLWIAPDGTPVSQAAASHPRNGMSRIGPVYTPAEHRRRGYGAAVTAEIARWALDGGARDVLLFADLDNPVSNSIYRRIGFRPVFEAVETTFAAGHTLDT